MYDNIRQPGGLHRRRAGLKTISGKFVIFVCIRLNEFNMSNKVRHKQVFEMNSNELNVQLRNTLDKELKFQASKNIPLVYRNNFCFKENQFIHEYPNGKKFLIEQDQATSKETILREF
jgi:hypothetical protein